MLQILKKEFQSFFIFYWNGNFTSILAIEFEAIIHIRCHAEICIWTPHWHSRHVDCFKVFYIVWMQIPALPSRKDLSAWHLMWKYLYQLILYLILHSQDLGWKVFKNLSQELPKCLENLCAYRSPAVLAYFQGLGDEKSSSVNS